MKNNSQGIIFVMLSCQRVKIFAGNCRSLDGPAIRSANHPVFFIKFERFARIAWNLWFAIFMCPDTRFARVAAVLPEGVLDQKVQRWSRRPFWPKMTLAHKNKIGTSPLKKLPNYPPPWSKEFYHAAHRSVCSKPAWRGLVYCSDIPWLFGVSER